MKWNENAWRHNLIYDWIMIPLYCRCCHWCKPWSPFWIFSLKILITKRKKYITILTETFSLFKNQCAFKAQSRVLPKNYHTLFIFWLTREKFCKDWCWILSYSLWVGSGLKPTCLSLYTHISIHMYVSLLVELSLFTSVCIFTDSKFSL